jgi:hypothetical protein
MITNDLNFYRLGETVRQAGRQIDRQRVKERQKSTDEEREWDKPPYHFEATVESVSTSQSQQKTDRHKQSNR